MRHARAGIAVVVTLVVVTLGALLLRRAEAEPSFVGSGRCADCHAGEYAAWQESQHSRAMQEARPGAVLGSFADPPFTEGDVATRFLRRDDRYVVNTRGSDGALHDYTVRYTFGVDPLQQYLVEVGGGRLQPLPMAWDSRPAAEGGQRWFSLTPGGPVAHTDPLHWSGRYSSWNYMCADCHSTGVRKGYEPVSDTFNTTYSEISVSCESCHGPGSRHARWTEVPRAIRRLIRYDASLPAALTERRGVHWIVDSAAGKPRRSEPRRDDREIETCAQCHARRAHIAEGYSAGKPLFDYYAPLLLESHLYFADGQQKAEVYTYGSFVQSRMYGAGVTCSDCHDPHSQQLRRPGDGVCTQCHLPQRYAQPAHHRHQTTSVGARCVSCHMPDTTYMEIDARRDHSMRVPRPDLSVRFGVPNACSRCHTDRDAAWAASQVRGWYGRDAVSDQRFVEAFAADDAGDPAASTLLAAVVRDRSFPEIIRGSALARLGGHAGPAAAEAAAALGPAERPLVRLGLLRLLEGLPARERIRLGAPLLRDSSRSIRIDAAVLLAPVADSLDASYRVAFDAAANEVVESFRYNADRVESRLALGTFQADLGRYDQALAEYRAALRLEPTYVAAHVNSADVLQVQGRRDEAERVLRDAIARVPGAAMLHHSLGLLLARAERMEDAVVSLRRAAELDSADFVHLRDLAVVLDHLGRRDEALAALQPALRRGDPRATELVQAFRAQPPRR